MMQWFDAKTQKPERSEDVLMIVDGDLVVGEFWVGSQRFTDLDGEDVYPTKYTIVYLPED